MVKGEKMGTMVRLAEILGIFRVIAVFLKVTGRLALKKTNRECKRGFLWVSVIDRD